MIFVTACAQLLNLRLTCSLRLVVVIVLNNPNFYERVTIFCSMEMSGRFLTTFYECAGLRPGSGMSDMRLCFGESGSVIFLLAKFGRCYRSQLEALDFLSTPSQYILL